ncbi:MAG: class B sortase [Clostridia bacterium]|nr:class B sortase [Clostridia bacterium]
MENNNLNAATSDEILDGVALDTAGAENAFISSLDEITAGEIAPDRPAKKKKKNFTGAMLRMLTVALCLSVFLYCVYELVLIMKQYQMSDDAYSDIASGFEQALMGDRYGKVGALSSLGGDIPMQNYDDISQNGVVKPPAVTPESPITSLKFQRVKVYLESLYEQNNDLIGYITIKGTVISYPVVQTSNNDYYLDHGFDRQVITAGAIFADCTNHPKVTENKNLVLYGHNFKNGAMFHQLVQFLQEDFFMNTTVELATFDGIYTFEVFAAYRTHINYRYYSTSFATDDAFVDFCYSSEKRSLYHKEGIEFDADDTILTLSTCVNGEKNYRYAIQAKLVNIER